MTGDEAEIMSAVGDGGIFEPGKLGHVIDEDADNAHGNQPGPGVPPGQKSFTAAAIGPGQ
jgi:hypothetical protein